MKLVVSTLEEVAEPLRGEYESKDGKFHLKTEGDYTPLVEANRKIAEFRDKNIALLKEVDVLRPLKTQFEGIDPVVAREAIAKVATFDKNGLKNAEDIEIRLKAMVEEHLKPVKEQLTASQAREHAAEVRANDLLFESSIGDRAAKAGAETKALKFLSGLARDAFEIKDGQVVAKTGKFSKEKPGDPLTPDEWIKDAALEHAYAFKPSTGGGAEGGAKPGAGRGTTTTVKPGQTVLKNPTPQELGAAAKDIATGKIRVEHDQ